MNVVKLITVAHRIPAVRRIALVRLEGRSFCLSFLIFGSLFTSRFVEWYGVASVVRFLPEMMDRVLGEIRSEVRAKRFIVLDGLFPLTMPFSFRRHMIWNRYSSYSS